MFQKFYETRTQIEADVIISRLRAAGLHPADLRTWPHVTLAGADLFFGVEIPVEEIEPARQVLCATDESRIPASKRAPWTPWTTAVVIVIVAIALGMVIP